jgi:hypothetical protein
MTFRDSAQSFKGIVLMETCQLFLRGTKTVQNEVKPLAGLLTTMGWKQNENFKLQTWVDSYRKGRVLQRMESGAQRTEWALTQANSQKPEVSFNQGSGNMCRLDFRTAMNLWLLCASCLQACIAVNLCLSHFGWRVSWVYVEQIICFFSSQISRYTGTILEEP